MKTLTKTIFVIGLFCTMLLVHSCSKDDTNIETKSVYKEEVFLYRSVTSDEYLNASDLVKRFIDQIDAAVNSIDILEKNNPSLKYEAIISIDKDPNNKLNNSIIIGLVDDSRDAIESKNAKIASPDGKCHVCGVRSAWACIHEVEEYMNKKHTDTISATITRTKDGCVDITYH